MQTIIIILIFCKIYEFVNYRSLARKSQELKRLMEELQDEEDLSLTMVTVEVPHHFLLQLLYELIYLGFCIFLLFKESTWAPGVMLLIISALESYATYEEIDGTCFRAEDGYTYPALWWRYVTSGSTLFILTRLLELEKLLAQ